MSALPASSLLAGMLAAQTERRSGMFMVAASDVRTRLYVAHGTLVYADQGTLGDTLGRILLHDGSLSSDQYAAAIDYMTRRLIDPEPMRFGEALVELGILGTDDVNEALAAQVRHKVARCLIYESAHWNFQPSAQLPARERFPCRVEPLLLAAVRRFEDQRVERILDSVNGCLRLTRDAATTTSELQLSVDEARFIQGIDGVTPTRVLLGRATSAVRDPAGLLAAVVLLQQAREAGPAIKGSGVPPHSATGVAITTTFPPAGATSRPPSPPRPLRSGRPSAASGVLSPVDGQAREAAPSATAALDPHAAQLVAEGAFQRAKRHIDTHALARALPELRRAVNLCPESAEYVLYLRWSESFASGDDTARPTLRSELGALASRAVEQDPTFAFGFFVLGQLGLLDGEDGERAIRLLRHALKLDPRLPDAERHLRVALRGGSVSDSESVQELSMLDIIATSVESTDAATNDRPVGRAADAARLTAGAPSRPPRAPPPEETPLPVALQPGLARPSTPPRWRPDPLPVDPEPTPGPSISDASIRRARAVRRGMSVALPVALVLGAVLFVAVRLRTPGGEERPSTALASTASAPERVAASASNEVPAPRVAAPSVPAPSVLPAIHLPAPAPPAVPNASASDAAPRFGELLTPPWAHGHRIFVDGKVVGEAPTPVSVRCGSHIVKVGSAGRPRRVELACGGSATVTP